MGKSMNEAAKTLDSQLPSPLLFTRHNAYSVHCTDLPTSCNGMPSPNDTSFCYNRRLVVLCGRSPSTSPLLKHQ